MVSILTRETMWLQLRALEEEKASSSVSSNPSDAVIFFGMSLVLGIACRHALRGTRVPYTVALLVLGIALGALEYGTHHGLGKIGDGIRLWANIDPDLLLAVFLPALLFESSFSMEVHQIKRCIVQMFLLAGPGVLISTFVLGSALKLAFPYNWSWKTSLLLGGLLSATDPVAVVALLKELGASKKLSTIIEGESLMNDGTAIVVYQLFYRMVLGWSFNWGDLIKFLSQATLGAVGIGLAFGIVSVLWLGFIFNDTIIEITLTFAVSYIAYFTAQEGAAVSGVLTVMTLGMFYSAVARTAFKGESQESLHHFWEMVAYIANTLIFILSGVVIAESILKNDNILKTHANSWGYLFLLYLFVQVARMAVVGILFPFLQYFGYGLDWKEAIILVWSGLRGAVALSLSLSVKRSSDHSAYISSDTGTLFVFLTGGIVFLTLIVNGSTTQFVLHILKMDNLSAAKKRILNYTKYEMLNKALEAFGDLGDDEELGPADWPTVKRYITSLNDIDGEGTHPHISSDNDDHLDHMNLTDTRVRFLNGVQAAYWVMLDEGRITETTANLLMRSVDEALDMVSREVLCDWNGLKSYVNMPNYYKFIQSSVVPQKLVTYFTVERLESACYICAAFLRAHRIARQQLHEFIGDSEVAASVIRESEQESEDAKKFLEDVRVTFPQVLRVVKTRQVTYSVLNHLIDYVHNLEKIGLLEEKEMSHLHDAVQTDLKKLLRNPPSVKIPKVHNLINTNPLLGALPPRVRETLAGSTKEIMKLQGATLYKEGSKPTGIWLISNGVVKWSSKSISNKPLLHPTFSHGSTLGLYEVLSQRPYICDIITDSVVIGFFIETEKILSALRSDPAVEDFFWRESIIVIAKVMLPQMFEKMSMQDLRALIVERSMMNIYIRGESFELFHRYVGFVLEGFIKLQDAEQEEMLTAPAAILPHVDQTIRRSGTLDSLCIRFNGKNYSAWAFHFQLFVKGKELWGHINGSVAAPNGTKELLEWETKDAKIMSWILGSVEPHIILNLRPYKTSRAMWEYLQRIHTQNNAARRFQLEYEIANSSQGALSIEEFYSGFSNLWADYTDIVYASVSATGLIHVQTVHETSKRDQFLMKLRPEFEAVRSQLMNRDPVPGLDVCFGDLLREEQRLLTRSTMEQNLLSPTQVAFVAQGKAKGRDYSGKQCYSCKEFGHIATHCQKKFCNYCKKAGHVIQDCAIRPPRRQERAYSASVEVSGAPSSHATAAANTPSITPDSIQQMVVSALSALGITGSSVREDDREGS